MHTLISIAAAAWDIFRESAPYMLFGFAVAGCLKAVVRPETVARHLGKNDLRSVTLAALVGIPIPL